MGVFEFVGRLIALIIDELDSISLFDWNMSLWELLIGVFVAVFMVKIVAFMFNMSDNSSENAKREHNQSERQRLYNFNKHRSI